MVAGGDPPLEPTASAMGPLFGAMCLHGWCGAA